MTTEKFYFIRNGQQIGPIEAEQLAQENITPQTMVWRQGMEDWKEAHLLPELDFLWQNNANNGTSGVPPFQHLLGNNHSPLKIILPIASTQTEAFPPSAPLPIWLLLSSSQFSAHGLWVSPPL